MEEKTMKGQCILLAKAVLPNFCPRGGFRFLPIPWSKHRAVKEPGRGETVPFFFFFGGGGGSYTTYPAVLVKLGVVHYWLDYLPHITSLQIS